MKNYIALLVTTFFVIAVAFTTIKPAAPEVWKVTTIAGWEDDNRIMDGTGPKAHFSRANHSAMDAADNLYVLDATCLRKVDVETNVITLFGVGAEDQNHYAIQVPELAGTSGICMDKSGNIYVSSANDHSIYKITPDKKVERFAGDAGYKGKDDGPRLEAGFYNPTALCFDKAGNMFVADTYNGIVRKISVDGKVTTLAGKGETGDFKPGVGKNAQFREIRTIAADSKGNVYVSQNNNNGGGSCIAKISPAGAVSNFVGDTDQWEKEGVSPDGTGKAARFMRINAIAVDKDDNLIIGEDSRVRKATPAGVVTTLAGNKTKDWRDAVGAKAMFRSIGGLSIDSKGNILVSDGNCIRKMEKQ